MELATSKQIDFLYDLCMARKDAKKLTKSEASAEIGKRLTAGKKRTKANNMKNAAKSFRGARSTKYSGGKRNKMKKKF